jgi:hypothetical protein
MCNIGADRSLSLDDFVDAPRRDTDVLGEVPDADASRGEELF